ncbi:PREDICTED: deoxyribonuclease-1-like 1 isoform X3 [Ceratotherium simum simum]|uniref:Deoxyribonuclease-1-like 1 n=1 Tax=Ceratotherium simum simum TaxID=73337 RepID=A0ABM1DMI1_CERSS|nr:PREDICTED: deoxyribonuclease-1-like 1 isoform X3 [Ceratotherium simum simum]
MHCPAALLFLLLASGAEAFRICAFNAQRLTLAKVAKEHVMDTLVRILARCDIMVLQEVVDPSGSAISLLLRELKRFDGSGPYDFLSSAQLGRSTYKEKYVYIYRSHKTQVLDSYTYDDKYDRFAREPFVAQFTLPSKGRRGRRVALLCGRGKGVWLALPGAWSPAGGWSENGQEWVGTLHPWGFTVLPSLVLVPLHTTPKDVETELNALYDVFLDVSQHWQSKDVILLGDFNADCASLTKKRLDELVLRTQAGFHWAIADGEDTTVRASTHCTYDRIVLHGERCQSLLRAAAAFDFPRRFQLTEEKALNISDHYPVEVELSRAACRVQPLGLPAFLLLSLLLPLLPPQLDLVA